MASPSISVVMSAYNDADYLSASIDSVLEQTERDFEFIIVNDGSPDPRTAKILAEYAKRDGRIRVITKFNEGLTKALIDGCVAARGEYIARIDVGDVMTPDRLQRQKSVLDAQPDVVLVTCSTVFLGPEHEYLYTVRGRQSDAAKDGLWITRATPTEKEGYLLDGPTSHPSVMMRTESYRAVGGYRWQFYYGQDQELWIRLARLGHFAGIVDALCYCRIFPDGLSLANPERQRKLHECLFGIIQARRRGNSETPYLLAAEKIRPDTIRCNNREKSRVGAAAGNYFVGEALRRGSDPRSAKYFRTACSLDPFRCKHWVRLFQSLALCGKLVPARFFCV